MMYHRSLVILAALAAATTGTLGAQSAAPDSAGFATKAAQGNMAEISSARLALQKTQNGVVKAFANKMIADHTKAEADLVKIMRAKGMTPPADVDAKHKQEMAKLRSLSGSAFDNAYIGGEVPDHQEMLSMMESEQNDSANADFASYAKQTIPVVQQHLDLAKADLKQLASH
jgi:putative membrane protein